MTVDTVAQLSNDTDGKTVDNAIVTTYIDSAGEIINGYLRGRYNLPLSSTHLILRDIAVEIVRYHLTGRRDTPNEFEQKQYDAVIESLKDIRKGVIQLDDGAPNEDKPVTIIATKHKPFLTRDFLKTY